jgi:hypothetical protein
MMIWRISRSPAVTRRGNDDPRDASDQALHLVLKLTEGPHVGTPLGPDDDVPGRCDREQVQSSELTEPALEPVSIDRRVSVSRHYEAHAQVCQRGSTHPNQQTVRSESLPLASDSFEVRPAANPCRARKSMIARRLRTSTAV